MGRQSEGSSGQQFQVQHGILRPLVVLVLVENCCNQKLQNRPTQTVLVSQASGMLLPTLRLGPRLRQLMALLSFRYLEVSPSPLKGGRESVWIAIEAFPDSDQNFDVPLIRTQLYGSC